MNMYTHVRTCMQIRPPLQKKYSKKKKKEKKEEQMYRWRRNWCRLLSKRVGNLLSILQSDTGAVPLRTNSTVHSNGREIVDMPVRGH